MYVEFMFRLSVSLVFPHVCSYVHNRILASNRSHIVKLPANRVLEQFTLIRLANSSVFNGVYWLLGVTAAEVHAHTPPIPDDLQPSLQRGLFSNCTETLWQHVCLPVSRIRPSLTEFLLHAFKPFFFLFQWFPHWKLAFHFAEWAGERFLYKTTGGVKILQICTEQ